MRHEVVCRSRGLPPCVTATPENSRNPVLRHEYRTEQPARLHRNGAGLFEQRHVAGALSGMRVPPQMRRFATDYLKRPLSAENSRRGQDFLESLYRLLVRYHSELPRADSGAAVSFPAAIEAQARPVVRDLSSLQTRRQNISPTDADPVPDSTMAALSLHQDRIPRCVLDVLARDGTPGFHPVRSSLHHRL